MTNRYARSSVALLIAIAVSLHGKACCASPKLTMEVRMVPASASRGEPLIAECTLTNKGMKTLTVYVPNAREEWLSVTSLVSSSGSRALRNQELPTVRPSIAMTETIQPGNYVIRNYVLSRRLPPLAVGEYKTTLEANIWAYETDVQSIAERVGPTATTAFTITPISSAHLRTLALELAKKASSSRNKEGDLAIQKLFCIPETVALPVWKQLISSDAQAGNPNNWRIVEELQRLATPAAIQLLWEMWQQDVPKSTGVLARQALEHLSFTLTGDPARRIQQMFLKLEGKIPKRTNVTFGYDD